jgi:hypothetical protein
MAKNPDRRRSPRRGLLGKRITKEQINAIYLRDFKKSLGLLGEPLPDPVSELHLKKMVGLLLHYGIDPKCPDCWFQGFYALALEHEKGFQIAQKTGPKKRYGENFLRDVEEIRARKGLKSDKAAILALQAEGRYRGYLPTLEARLREAKAARKKREKKKREKEEQAAAASREAFVREAKLALESHSSRPEGATKLAS